MNASAPSPTHNATSEADLSYWNLCTLRALEPANEVSFDLNYLEPTHLDVKPSASSTKLVVSQLALPATQPIAIPKKEASQTSVYLVSPDNLSEVSATNPPLCNSTEPGLCHLESSAASALLPAVTTAPASFFAPASAAAFMPEKEPELTEAEILAQLIQMELPRAAAAKPKKVKDVSHQARKVMLS